MNFHQAPITRYLNIPATTASATFTNSTVNAQAFTTTAPLLTVSSAATWQGGAATNVFFETPSWPSGTFSINLEYNATAAATPLAVAPNVMMVDADANYFIRGSSLFASSTTVAVGTAAVSINVVYSASLINVVPVGSRASAANSAWVQPGDRIDIYKSFGSNGNTTAGVSYPATGSNQSTVETGTDITVQACRHRTGSTSYALDFNAAIRSTGFHAHITGKTYLGPVASPGVITVTAGDVLPYNNGDAVILTYTGGVITGVTTATTTVYLGNITRTPDGPTTFQVYTSSAAAAIAGAGGVAITGSQVTVTAITPLTSGTAIFEQHLSGGNGNTAALDLAIRYSNGTVKKLAVDGLTLQVQGRSSVDNSVLWTGTLTSAINLSYTANNKAGLIASMFDPARFTQVSKLWAKYNTRPLPGSTTAMGSQKISIDRDNNAGGEPYRCISIINTGSVAYQVALTINPIS